MKNILKTQILLFLIAISTSSLLLGQETIITKNGLTEEIYFDRSEACNKEVVFRVVEKMPEYKGGLEQLALDLSEAISFDKKLKAGIAFRCTVNCEGKIFGFQPAGDIHPLTETIQHELMRLQNWEAGKHREMAVDCFMAIGISIKRGKIVVI